MAIYLCCALWLARNPITGISCAGQVPPAATPQPYSQEAMNSRRACPPQYIDTAL
jgi:hypothetical protein